VRQAVAHLQVNIAGADPFSVLNQVFQDFRR
jgi:hypothetical protein